MNRTISRIAFLLFTIAIISCRGRLYRIPSSSMANTLKPGETVNVSPASSYERNDVACFEIFADDYMGPSDEEGKYKKNWQKRISRIVAVSGDSLQIKKGDLYLNGRLQLLPPEALGTYIVTSVVPIDDFLNNSDYSEVQILKQNGDTLTYRTELTARQAADYERRKPAVIEVKKVIEETMGNLVTPLATNCGSCVWSVDFYGPIRIPMPGETVTIDSSNYLLYQHIPGIARGPQVIKEKLYFFLGDNRHGAEDSRYIGFIPHSKMYGIVK
jgi:signal peptidase I